MYYSSKMSLHLKSLSLTGSSVISITCSTVLISACRNNTIARITHISASTLLYQVLKSTSDVFPEGAETSWSQQHVCSPCFCHLSRPKQKVTQLQLGQYSTLLCFGTDGSDHCLLSLHALTISIFKLVAA